MEFVVERCPNGEPGYVCLPALRWLGCQGFKDNSMQRFVARLRARDPEFARHCFCERGVNGTRRQTLVVDAEGLEMLLSRLPERVVGDQRRRAIRLMRCAKERGESL